jgi:predicted  nucleic acid-binding Zn-ribbon protein
MMTEPADDASASDPDHPENQANQDRSRPEVSMPQWLLELQEIDTRADQLRIRRERSQLHDDLAAASQQLSQWERRRAELRERIDALTVAVEAAEHRGAELATHRARL